MPKNLDSRGDIIPGSEVEAMVAEVVRVGAPSPEAAERIARQVFNGLLVPLRLIGPESQAKITSSITVGLARLRQAEDRILAAVALRSRFEKAVAVNPSMCLLTLEGWRLAEKELLLRKRWDAVMNEAWFRHVLACAKYNNVIRPKEEVLKEMKMAFRPGLAG